MWVCFFDEDLMMIEGVDERKGERECEEAGEKTGNEVSAPTHQAASMPIVICM